MLLIWPLFEIFQEKFNLKNNFKIRFIQNHLVFDYAGDAIFIDTGSPITISRRSGFVFLGKHYKVKEDPSFLDELSYFVGGHITTLMGMDIIGEYNVLFDYANERVTFSKDVIPFYGATEIRNLSPNAIPASEFLIGDRRLRLFIDTGAIISYIREDVTRNFQNCGYENDFYPGLGAFQTPCYEIDTRILGYNFKVKYGILPDVLGNRIYNLGVDGVIGYDFFRNFKVLIREGRQIFIRENWEKFFKGEDEEAQNKLDELFDSIDRNASILWYPSAGNDFRDLLENSEERARVHGITNIPSLFIHSDYSSWRKETLENSPILHQDGRTTVYRENIYKLRFNFDPADFFDFRNYGRTAPLGNNIEEPEAYLLDIRIESNRLGEIRKPVIYFIAENLWLLDVLLTFGIKISHLVKVRDGSGFGGGYISMNILYYFLKELGVEYLFHDDVSNGARVSDDMVRELLGVLSEKVFLETKRKIEELLREELSLYTLLDSLECDYERINNIYLWSGLIVDILKIRQREI